MNKYQKEVLANYTCGILDRYPDMDEYLQSHGIDERLLKKMKKAFDLIYEVNQECHKKEIKNKKCKQ